MAHIKERHPPLKHFDEQMQANKNEVATEQLNPHNWAVIRPVSMCKIDMLQRRPLLMHLRSEIWGRN